MSTAVPTRDRIVAGTLAAVEAEGLAGFTLEDVATASGVARATIYRHFPGGREDLVHAAVEVEVDRFLVGLRDAVAGAPDLAELLVRGLQHADATLGAHRLLQHLLTEDPDRLMPELQRLGDRVLFLVRSFIAAELEARQDELRPDVDPGEVADYLSRLSFSYFGSPGGWDLQDRSEVERLVRTHFVAGILPLPR